MSALESRITQEQAKLDGIRQQVAAAEARAEAARIEAEYQGCRAQVKEMRAEVERRRAVCAKDVADHNFCLAQNSAREATSGLWGCGLGIVAAAFSAGAAAPWALGGCAVGVGAGVAAADQCPAPRCADEMNHTASDVLAERGLKDLPRCGGYVGVRLEPIIEHAPAGRQISRVSAGTYANAANMASGDLLLSINGVPVAASADFDTALAPVREGQPLHVSVVRRGELFDLSAPASRRSVDGTLAETTKLGVELGPTVEKISYSKGVQVAEVVPGSPAAGSIQVGDVVLELGAPATERHSEMNGKIAQVGQAETFLEDVRASEVVTFSVQRGPDVASERVHLAPRSGRAEL